MARSTLSDYLQVYPFWLMDIAPIEPLSLPVFTPTFGFSSIVAPELTLEMEEITEGNSLYRRKVVKRGDTSGITLTRGASWIDSDFYSWATAALKGTTGGLTSPIPGALSLGGVTPRRNLLLVWFFSRNAFGSSAAAAAAILGGVAALGAAGSAGGGVGSVISSAATAGATAAAGAMTAGPFEFAARLPAKAYILKNCLPGRYKPGSDFDAQSGSISIQELDVTMEGFEEISLASVLP
jgi:T4-like virus tail tube protein gp19